MRLCFYSSSCIFLSSAQQPETADYVSISDVNTNLFVVVTFIELGCIVGIQVAQHSFLVKWVWSKTNMQQHYQETHTHEKLTLSECHH